MLPPTPNTYFLNFCTIPCFLWRLLPPRYPANATHWQHNNNSNNVCQVTPRQMQSNWRKIFKRQCHSTATSQKKKNCCKIFATMPIQQPCSKTVQWQFFVAFPYLYFFYAYILAIFNNSLSASFSPPFSYGFPIFPHFFFFVALVIDMFRFFFSLLYH